MIVALLSELTTAPSPDLPRTFTAREVVEVLLAFIALDAVEVGLTLAGAVVVTGDPDGTEQVTVARCKNAGQGRRVTCHHYSIIKIISNQ